ncbi:hypothetical protein PUN28_005120 [Cardiocondyla obscurior]|uniref:Uncharacterized protein n=1 Tax=Cardiocondyla obscurior TaxID=286306 RepID=A0AAW2GIU1_9HYME
MLIAVVPSPLGHSSSTTVFWYRFLRDVQPSDVQSRAYGEIIFYNSGPAVRFISLKPGTICVKRVNQQKYETRFVARGRRSGTAR